MTIDLPNPDATRRLGLRLATVLNPSTVVALVGPLGAGKTHLVRAIADGLGVLDGRVVTSPTFTLIHEYVGRLPIYHFDAYRLRDMGDFFDLGAHEYLQGDGVCLIEWADRVALALPAEHLRIELAVTGTTERRATLTAAGERCSAMLAHL